MDIGKFIRRAAIGIGGLIGLVALVLIFVVVTGTTIRLNFIRNAVEEGAAEALGRPVKIAGDIRLTPTLRPTASVSGVSVGNPAGWGEKDFVSVELARAQIDLRDLMAKEITIGEITAEGITFNFVTDEQNRNNWNIGPADQEDTSSAPKASEPEATETPEPTPADAEKSDEKRIRFTALERLSLKNIAVQYRDEVMKKSIEFVVADFSGSAKEGQPVAFSLHGSIQDREYKFNVDGGSFDSLRDTSSPWPLKLSGTIAGTPLDAKGELEQKDGEPILHLGFSLGKVDIGAILTSLGMAEGVEASTDQFGFEATLRGDSLHELASRSEMAMTLTGGQWILQSPATQARLPIGIVDGTIRVAPEQPVVLTIDGRIDQAPVTFTIEGQTLVEYVTLEKDMSVHIGAEAGGAKLTLDGRLAIPASTKDASLDMTFSGDGLNSLGELVHLDLPPFGPYSLKARFAVVETGYELSDLKLKIGESELDGNMTLDMSGPKPRAEVKLVSQRLQIDDFSTGDWSSEHHDVPPAAPTESKTEKPETPEDTGTADKENASGRKTAAMLSPEVLNAFDAVVNIEMTQVVSGTSDLGGGVIDLTLKDGRLAVEPLRIDASGGAVEAVLVYRDAGLDVTIQVDKLDSFDELFGIDLPPFGPFGLKARMAAVETGYALSDLSVKVGESELTGEVTLDTSGEKPRVDVQLASQHVQLRDFSTEGWSPGTRDTTKKKPKTKEAEKTEQTGSKETVALLSPEVLGAFEAALNIEVAKVLSGADTLGNAILVTGKVQELDGEPALQLGLSLGKLDIGDLLARLKVAEDLEASTDRFKLDATLRGSNLNELAGRSVMSMTLEGGQWMLRDPNTQATLPIQIVDGGVRVEPNKPVTVDVNGKIDRTPVAFSIQTMSLSDLVKDPKALSVHIGAKAAGADLTLDGKLAVPVQTMDASLDMMLTGDKIDSLDELLKIDLPPIGPYSLKAKFAVKAGGYELSGLNVKVGTSELTGDMTLDMKGSKPEAAVRLTAKRLQIDDFSTGDWSPEKKAPSDKPEAPSEKTPENSKDETAAENRQKAAALLSPEVMGLIDAALSIEVTQVLSGQDALGGGVLNVALQDGRFSVDPLKLEVPGGTVQADFSFHPTGSQTEIHIGADIDQFDYGILARRIDPETKTEGKVSLKVMLDGSAPELSQLLANSNGKLDFALLPGGNFDASIFDLWAVNLISSLSKEMDDEPESTVNCVVARFGLDDGLMTEKAIFMDTTRMSINAEATINFKTRTIEVKAAPEAKRPEYFSLATPVKVTGSFSDFGIGINKLSLAKTATSFVVSPLTVPIKRLFKGEIPADGAEACKSAWQYEEAPEETSEKAPKP